MVADLQQNPYQKFIHVLLVYSRIFKNICISEEMHVCIMHFYPYIMHNIYASNMQDIYASEKYMHIRNI